MMCSDQESATGRNPLNKCEHVSTVLQRISLETDLHESVSMTMADSLRVLLEHGLLDEGRSLNLSDGCFPAWRAYGNKKGKKRGKEDCAAWKVVKHYYTIKVSRISIVHVTIFTKHFLSRMAKTFPTKLTNCWLVPLPSPWEPLRP